MELILSTDKKTEIKMSAPKSTISISGAKGTKNHQALYNLDYENSGHTGFQKELIFDDTPTEGSNNPVKSGGVKAALDGKADKGGVYKKNEVYNKSEIDSKLLNVYTHYRGASDLSTFYMTANANQVLDYTFSETEFTYDVNITYPSNTAIWNLSFSVDEDYGYSKTKVLLASSHCPFLNVGNKITIKFDDGARYETTVISNDSFSLTATGDFTSAPTQGDGSIDKSRVVSLILSCTIYVKHGDNIALVELSDKSRFLDNLSGKSQSVLIFDSTPTAGSENPVTSNGIKTAIDCLKSASVPHTTVSGYPISLTDALNNENIISCKIYGNTGGVGDLDANTGKYKIPIKIQGKNLIPYPYLESSKTTNDVTFTVNEDGTITVSGTATANTSFSLASAIYYTLPKKVYFWSGCPTGGGATTYNSYVNILKRTETSWKIVKTIYDYGNGAAVDLRQYDYDGITITISVTKDTTMNNAVFKPLLEENSGASEYEKYIEAVTTISLNEPLQAGEFTNVSSLKTINSDRNYISCDTAVAPSKIDLEYYQDINKVIAEIKAAILSNGGNI